MTKSSKKIYKNLDTFSKLAKASGFRSRSAIKLLEIQKKDNFIKPNSRVLDLGSSPGGWSQVCQQIAGKKGFIFSVDKKIMEPLRGVKYLNKELENLKQSDFENFNENILPFDVVLSDIAPNISGISERDDALMIDLLENVLRIQSGYLKNKGHLVVKVFQGESLEFMRKKLKQLFKTVKVRKPISSRSSSREVYLVAMEKI